MTSKFSPSPVQRSRLQRAVASLALLLSAGAAHAEVGDNITLELDPVDGSYDDLDPIGIDNCVDALSKKITLSAIIADQDPNQDTRKFLFVVQGSEQDCSLSDLEAAFNTPGTAVNGCTWVGGTSDYDKTAEVNLKEVALRTLLPNNGVDACTNGEQRSYQYYLMVAPDPTKHAKGWTRPGSKASTDGGVEDSGTGDATTTVDEPYVATRPVTLEIDLSPPKTPAETYQILANDQSVQIEFPSDQGNEIAQYQVCWSGGSGPSGCKTSSDASSVTIGTDDGLKVESAYSFTAAAIDDAGNLGQAVSIGSGAVRDFLDVAQYYRQMHGPETGGCHSVPGRGVGGLIGGLLVALTAAFVRRRSKSSCA